MATVPNARLAFPTPPDSSMGNPKIFGALSSRVRIDLLRAVTTGPRGIADLVRELGVHRATVRYHLGYLLREGLVEEVRPRSSGRVGRPAILYQAMRHAGSATFQRRFELLGQIALETLVEAVGAERASDRLRKKGIGIGAAMLRTVSSQTEVTRWTPADFERLVLNGLFEDMGVVTEVRDRTSDSVVYRVFSCPFLELAEKMPEQVCDSLDQGFHEGIDQALGGPRTTRVACMGHGSPFCEYRLEWKSAKRARPRGRVTARDSSQGDDEA